MFSKFISANLLLMYPTHLIFVILSEAKSLCNLLSRRNARSFATLRTTICVERSSQFIRFRVTRVRIIVEAFARLTPVPACHHQTFQQRRRREAALFEFVIHYMGDVIGRIEADEIEQRERPHGIAAAQFHGIENVAVENTTFM